jgi:ABC-2 type transport system permease protein
MKNLLESVIGLRFWPLMAKELRQIRRNRRLVISLIIPPTLMILIFGFALNPEVTDLRLGVVDLSRSAESRDLVSALGESRAFTLKGYYSSSDELGSELSKGHLDIGVVIPWDFARMRARKETADVQLLLDGVNTNTAQIAGGYAALVIQSLNAKIAAASASEVAAVSRPSVPPGGYQNAPAAIAAASAPSAVMPGGIQGAAPTDGVQPSEGIGSGGQMSRPPTAAAGLGTGRGSVTPPPIRVNADGPKIGRSSIITRIALLFNPGLQNSWFIITGTLGILLVLNGSVVSAASMIKEKEVGTIEQLLMTPATATEITVAKMGPIFLLLLGQILLALLVGYIVFGVPMRGSFLLLVFAGSLCVLTGIGMGTTLATFTRSQQQAQLMSFFINPPISMLSGATYPIEGMPHWLQPVTLINPVRHFSIIARGVMLKGVGLDVLYPNVLVLLGISLTLIAVSSWRFRKQLG